MKRWYQFGSIVCLSMMVTSCYLGSKEQQAQEESLSAQRQKIANDIKVKGYAEVGKLPDGTPLYMMYTPVGKVLFTNTATTVTTNENCGKNCVETITTIRK